jgi:phosphate-selective porin
MNMKTVSTIFSAAALSLFAFTASAHSVTATGNTLDSAEAVIAKKAKELNATDYKITSAHMGNKVTMSAVLDK